MTKYKVTGGVVRLGPGQTLVLSGDQIRSRLHALDVPKGFDPRAKNARSMKVVTKGPVEFKIGEVIGLDALPRHLAGTVEAVDAPSVDQGAAA